MEVVRVDEQDGTIFVRFGKEFEPERAPKVKAAVEKALEGKGPINVVVDLAELEMMSSVAIGFLVSLEARLREKGSRVYLYRAPDKVRRTLEMVRLSEFFSLIKDESELADLSTEE